MPIQISDSWFSVKCILVQCAHLARPSAPAHLSPGDLGAFTRTQAALGHKVVNAAVAVLVSSIPVAHSVAWREQAMAMRACTAGAACITRSK